MAFLFGGANGGSVGRNIPLHTSEAERLRFKLEPATAWVVGVYVSQANMAEICYRHTNVFLHSANEHLGSWVLVIKGLACYCSLLSPVYITRHHTPPQTQM